MEVLVRPNIASEHFRPNVAAEHRNGKHCFENGSDCPRQGLLGNGKAHISTVASIAQAQCLDGAQAPAIQAFASLGSGGAHSQNQERDLHRWLKNLYNVQLEVYSVPFRLQAVALG